MLNPTSGKFDLERTDLGRQCRISQRPLQVRRAHGKGEGPDRSGGGKEFSLMRAIKKNPRDNNRNYQNGRGSRLLARCGMDWMLVMISWGRLWIGMNRRKCDQRVFGNDWEKEKKMLFRYRHAPCIQLVLYNEMMHPIHLLVSTVWFCPINTLIIANPRIHWGQQSPYHLMPRQTTEQYSQETVFSRLIDLRAGQGKGQNNDSQKYPESWRGYAYAKGSGKVNSVNLIPLLLLGVSSDVRVNWT